MVKQQFILLPSINYNWHRWSSLVLCIVGYPMQRALAVYCTLYIAGALGISFCTRSIVCYSSYSRMICYSKNNLWVLIWISLINKLMQPIPEAKTGSLTSLSADSRFVQSGLSLPAAWRLLVAQRLLDLCWLPHLHSPASPPGRMETEDSLEETVCDTSPCAPGPYPVKQNTRQHYEWRNSIYIRFCY